MEAADDVCSAQSAVHERVPNRDVEQEVWRIGYPQREDNSEGILVPRPLVDAGLPSSEAACFLSDICPCLRNVIVATNQYGVPLDTRPHASQRVKRVIAPTPGGVQRLKRLAAEALPSKLTIFLPVALVQSQLSTRKKRANQRWDAVLLVL